MDELHFSVRYENYESVFIRRVKTDDDSITHTKLRDVNSAPPPMVTALRKKNVYIISYDAVFR